MLEKLSPITIGNRIKSTRMLAGFSRSDFSNATGISLPTLTAWETPPLGRSGLTKKGASILEKAFRKLEIECTKEWLLYGNGYSPRLLKLDYNVSNSDSSEVSWRSDESLIRDIESFKENNSNAVIHLVLDDFMLPIYTHGSYVGGSKKNGIEIQKLIGLDCIISLKEGGHIIRRIQNQNKDGSYILGALNVNKQIPLIIESDIEYAAEIIWVRKKPAIY